MSGTALPVAVPLKVIVRPVSTGLPLKDTMPEIVTGVQVKSWIRLASFRCAVTPGGENAQPGRLGVSV